MYRNKYKTHIYDTSSANYPLLIDQLLKAAHLLQEWFKHLYINADSFACAVSRSTVQRDDFMKSRAEHINLGLICLFNRSKKPLGRTV